MKKNLILIVLLIFMLCSCTSSIKKDLIVYINSDITKALEIQKESVTQYEKFISTSSYSFDELSDILNNYLIPTYETLIKELNNIKPVTKKVQEIHNIYIKGVNKQLEALYKIKQGAELKDKEMIKEGNEMLKEASNYYEMYKKEIFKLSDQYGLKYTK